MSLFNCKKINEVEARLKQLEEKDKELKELIKFNQKTFIQVIEGLSRELDLSIYVPTYTFSMDAVSVFKRINKK